MTLHPSRRIARRRVVPILVVASLIAAPWSTSHAQSAKETSLGFVPADAAFYGATMRTGETFQAFVNSRAFDRLKNMESVRTLTEAFLEQWNDPGGDFAQARAVLEQPETQETLAFLGDLFSHEMWSFGDMKHADLVELGNAVGLEMRKAQFQMQLDQQQGADPNPMLIVNAFIKALDQHRDKIVVPNSITGFKVADVDRAEEQLAKLDALVSTLVQGNPVLQPNYSKQTIAGSEYMVLDLKGSMVPWQFAGFFLQGIDFAAFNRVVGQLNELELTIALGVRDDHVLFLLADSGSFLETLGGDDVLYDVDDLAPLRNYSDATLMNVRYVSGAYQQRVGDPAAAIAALQQMAESLLPQLPVEGDLRDRIAKDLRSIGEWTDGLLPEPGAQLSFEYRTDRGYEGFAYDWSKNVVLDGSKSLPLVNHVGGDPVGFLVVRTQYRPEDYDTMVVVLEKVYGYVETYLMSELSEEEKTAYQSVMKIVEPQLKRLDTTTREKLIPALKDGQGGIVLDMKATSRQWFTEMPPARKPVAIPEIAFVYGVSDRDLLAEACAEYHDVAQKLLDELHEFSPDEIPPIKLPTPRESTVASGTLYEYEIPRDTGLDPQIAPSAGLGDDVAAWSFVPKQTSRLLEETPIVQDGGPLGNLDRDLAAAARFDFAAFVDGVEPWVEYGVTQYFASQAISTEGRAVFQEMPPLEQILGEIATGAEILKCFRGYSSVTYMENGATVTHFDYHFEDLED